MLVEDRMLCSSDQDPGYKRQFITDAMNTITLNTCISFKLRDYEPDYVEIQNVKGTQWSQFELVGKYGATTYDLPYDYTSVMHYGKKVFSRNGGITMQTLDSKYEDVIGNAQGPSANDYRKVCLIYGCQAGCAS
ncbi:unnamed protein product [Heligmosomoides polygyrus]|uniref:Astacin domain-containing protein n=1 Tax=Heligmosomoides polygyrus TaxID=6339 RepID=A0A183GHP4_HELPZ|nr:unnamed protein product [Heligmosomoides polygyrus]